MAETLRAAALSHEPEETSRQKLPALISNLPFGHSSSRIMSMLTGKALRPALKVVPDLLQFGECPVNSGVRLKHLGAFLKVVMSFLLSYLDGKGQA